MSNSRQLRRSTMAGLDHLEVRTAVTENRIRAYVCTTSNLHLTITMVVDRGEIRREIPCGAWKCSGRARSLGQTPKAAGRWKPTHEWYMAKGPEAAAMAEENGDDWAWALAGGLFLRDRATKTRVG